MVVQGAAQLDFARGEFSVSPGYEHDIAFTRPKNRFAGDHHARVAPDGFDKYIGIHIRFEFQVGIVKCQANDHISGFALEIGINKGHLAGIGFARQVGQGHAGRQSFPDHGQFVFINVGLDPDPGKIGDLVNRFAGHDIAAFNRVFFRDNAGKRRTYRDGPPGMPQLFDLSDFRLGNIVKEQPAFYGIKKVVRAGGAFA